MKTIFCLLLLNLSAGYLFGRSAPDTIIKVQWRQISGPVATRIDSPNHARTWVHGLSTPGTYTFEFCVTNKYGTDCDTSKVNVAKGVLGVIRADLSYRFYDWQEVLYWSISGNNIGQVILQKGYDGGHFDSVAQGGVIGSQIYAREPLDAFFRLQIFTDGAYVYSKTILIPGTKVRLTVRSIGQTVIINSSETGRFALINEMGQILAKGEFGVGDTKIDVSQFPGEILFMKTLTLDGIKTFKMPYKH
jgi:hypothetical protein